MVHSMDLISSQLLNEELERNRKLGLEKRIERLEKQNYLLQLFIKAIIEETEVVDDDFDDQAD